MARIWTDTDAARFAARHDEAGFNRELLGRIGETTPDLIYAKDRDSRMMFANRAVLGILGRTWDDIRGRSDIEWHDDRAEAVQFVAADARVMETGVTESVEETLTGHDGTRVYLSSKSPLRDASGTVIGICGISRDITAIKDAEAQRKLLLDEMNHRVKNALAMIMAIARQTLVGVDADAWASFDARVLAMAHANETLAGENWAAADVGAIVAEALGAHGDGRIDAAGPTVEISASATLSLSLALHELGTNALKYGALSVPRGRVEVRWRIVAGPGAPKLAIDWREIDGALVTPPVARGFGSRLIERLAGDTAGTRARLDFRPGGVECRLVLPLAVPVVIAAAAVPVASPRAACQSG
jgi:PAS domain S-box-containing protein